MRFSLSFTWSYDPLGSISKIRVENKSTPYIHTHKLDIERYINKLEWTENTLQEAEDKLVSKSTSQTPVPQEKAGKRMREEDSPLVIEASGK